MIKVFKPSEQDTLTAREVIERYGDVGYVLILKSDYTDRGLDTQGSLAIIADKEDAEAFNEMFVKVFMEYISVHIGNAPFWYQHMEKASIPDGVSIEYASWLDRPEF